MSFSVEWFALFPIARRFLKVGVTYCTPTLSWTNGLATVDFGTAISVAHRHLGYHCHRTSCIRVKSRCVFVRLLRFIYHFCVPILARVDSTVQEVGLLSTTG